MSNRKTEVVCPLIFANRIIGGKWKMRILWHIIHGENRFGILKKCIPEEYMEIKEILCAICKLAKRHADKNGEPIQEDTYQKVRYCTEGPDGV